MQKIMMLWILSSFILCAQPLNINFKNIDINKLIELTSLNIKKSILTPHPINAKVNFSSTKLHKNDDLLHILRLSLQSNGYDLIQEENIYRVIKTDNIKSQLVELKNANAKEILTIINEINYDNLKVSLIEDLNSLLLIGKPYAVQRIKTMIKRLDLKRLQVYVKAKIIEVNNEKLNHIGIQYGIFKSKSTSSELFSFSSSLNGLNRGFDISTLNDLGLSISSNSALALGASINLLKQNHAINIVSEPSILCLNNKESSIYVGEKKSIRTASTITDGGTTKESYIREDIGLTLKVRPRISSDNKVLLHIQTLLENFSQTNVTNNQPDTSKKEIFTTAIVDNGESVIIGGLIENRDESINNDVPFLSDVPILGNLFKDNNHIKSKKNLIIIITPYIVPQNSNLTSLREQLAKLYILEEQYLNQSLKIIEEKEKKETMNIKETFVTQSLHEERMQELFGY